MSFVTSTASAFSSRLGRQTALINRLRPTYDRVLDFLHAETGIPAQAGPETFMVCPRARKFVSLEMDVYNYMKANIQPGHTVLDVGSFLGLYAILAARWVGTNGRVIAFEPTPASLPLLHRHLAMNGALQNVTCLSCAVGSGNGGVQLFQHDDAYRNSVGVADPSANAAKAVKVPMLSIDETCALFELEPDFIRIDVQGLESEVLQGAANTIRKHSRLKIIVEVHPQLWPLHGMDETKFRHLLGELGLTATDADDDSPEYLPDAHLVLRPIAT